VRHGILEIEFIREIGSDVLDHHTEVTRVTWPSLKRLSSTSRARFYGNGKPITLCSPLRLRIAVLMPINDLPHPRELPPIARLMAASVG